MYGIKIIHSKTAVVGMEIGRIEHMVAQMSHKQALGEIAMERFCQELVASGLT